MKTLKALKITSILNSIFCIFCVASTVCFAFAEYFSFEIFFAIGMILLLGWMINPVGIISFQICITVFIEERKQSQAKKLIGKKWIWIFIWPIITTVFWVIGGLLFVKFTGGV